MLHQCLRAEEDTVEDMEAAIRAGMLVTLVTTEDIMQVTPATGIEGF